MLWASLIWGFAAFQLFPKNGELVPWCGFSWRSEALSSATFWRSFLIFQTVSLNRRRAQTSCTSCSFISHDFQTLQNKYSRKSIVAFFSPGLHPDKPKLHFSLSQQNKGENKRLNSINSLSEDFPTLTFSVWCFLELVTEKPHICTNIQKYCP